MNFTETEPENLLHIASQKFTDIILGAVTRKRIHEQEIYGFIRDKVTNGKAFSLMQA